MWPLLGISSSNGSFFVGGGFFERLKEQISVSEQPSCPGDLLYWQRPHCLSSVIPYLHPREGDLKDHQKSVQ